MTNYFQIFVPCSLEGAKFVFFFFFSLQLSQPCVEGRVVEANTSVLGPFENIYFALCQLACAMATRVRPVPWASCYYFAPLEIRQKDITLNTQNQKLTVLLGTPKKKQHICNIHNHAETENQNLCLSKRPGLQLDTIPTFRTASEFPTMFKRRVELTGDRYKSVCQKR